jgi:16S rRNA (cytidine1402-2'-O)-methyltransferase
MPPGTLFVVATPIGNLEDITLRALRVLREADVIAAEDTRRTAKLLAHYGISTPTISFHEHNARARVPQLIGRLREGARVAVVSDAGTPGISDPGVELVQACREGGVPVDPIPGPSAPLAAAMASGFPLVPVSILGFAPARSSDRKRWLSMVSGIYHTCVFFEAPTRMAKMLEDASVLMVERPMLVARELTKVHQEFLSGTISDLKDRFTTPRGEFTIVLGPWQARVPETAAASDHDIAEEFWRLAKADGRTRREAIGLVAKRFDKSQRDVYLAVERTKSSIK